MDIFPSDGWNNRLLGLEKTDLPIKKEQRPFINEFKEALRTGAIKTNPLVNCPCGGDQFILIAHQDRFGLPFSSHLCLNCGLICTSPIIAAEDLPKYYDEHYTQLIFGRRDAPPMTFNKLQGEKIFSRLPPLKKKVRILEIGAGSGIVLDKLRQSAQNVGIKVECFGTDYSQTAVNTCQKLEIEMVQGSIDEALKKWDAFDVVILSHVLEHIYNMAEFLEKTKQIIRQYGLLYVEVPGVMSLHEKPEYSFDFLRYMIHCHFHQFNLKSLAWHVEKSGFKFIAGSELAYGIFMNINVNNNFSITPDSFNAIEIFCYLRHLEKNLPSIQKRHIEYEEMKFILNKIQEYQNQRT